MADPRVNKNFRISADLDRRLKAAAAERCVSVNLLVVAAISDYLDRLPSVSSLLGTDDRPSAEVAG